MKTSQNILTFTTALMLVMPGVTPCFAEVPQLAGIVTHVFGTATLQHGVEGEARPIHFKEKVYIQDTIKTDEESVVRVLMGNKALVTIGEMSVLTITEEVHHATLDIESGAISLSVARKRMNPGEYIEIRTPHAVAAIRGTKLIAEVANKHSTRVSVIEGHVDTAFHASDPTNQFSMNHHEAFEFFKPEFKKRPRIQKLHSLSRRSFGGAQPGMNAHRLPEVVRGPAEEDVAQKQMTKAMNLANQLAPTVSAVNGQQQVISSGNSGSSTTASSSTQSSPTGEVAAVGTHSSGTPDSSTSSSSAPVASAPAPVASAPAPVASAPAPVASAPAPVASAPAPVASAPAPVASAPAPVASAPAPVASAPAPMASAPAPMASAPAPMASIPAPMASIPAPQAPSPSFNVAEIQKAFQSSGNDRHGDDHHHDYRRRGKSGKDD